MYTNVANNSSDDGGDNRGINLYIKEVCQLLFGSGGAIAGVVTLGGAIVTLGGAIVTVIHWCLKRKGNTDHPSTRGDGQPLTNKL